MLLANQIAVFFNHQYLWKETSNVLIFLHGDISHRKIASKSTTVGWIWPATLSLNLTEEAKVFSTMHYTLPLVIG